METAGAAVETVVAGVAIVPEVAAAGWVTAEAGEALATGLLEKTIEPHIVPGNTNMGVARTLLPQAGKLFESAFVANAKGENPSLLQHVGSLVPGVNVVMGIVSIHDHCF